MGNNVKFDNRQQMEFFTTLRKRVDSYFKENNISKNADWRMVAKSIFFLGGMAGTYLLIMFGPSNPYILLGLAIVLGLFMAFVGLNVSHDAIHGAYSKNPTINTIMGKTFNLIGANDYMWNIMHNIIHHTYTNIPGHDEDIESVPVIVRTSPKQEHRWFHRFQHYYAWVIYSFASFFWVFVKDYAKFFSDEIGNYDNTDHPTSAYINLFAFKAIYYVLFLVLPIIYLPVAWWQVLLGFLVMHIFTGTTLAVVFMLAHLVEGPDFPTPDEEGNIERSWVTHQLYTTADFARKNPVVNFFLGGLNFQIEHHLFPGICHVHYYPISEIVKNTAEEFGLPYYENDTLWGAIRSHQHHLKRQGKMHPVSSSEEEEAAKEQKSYQKSASSS